ncbi:4'-phosphopantetheinyl transferase family protein [Enterococcus larvae]|uniref:4'-phosphopantetheinyl transferase family protein n=1 Tax=Enterococcus larvae TaxID=2794352 RepID=UPI003F3F7545
MLKIKKFTEIDIEMTAQLNQHEIHVWTVSWKNIQQWVGEKWELLSEEERLLLKKYRFKEDCMRSATGKILSKYLCRQYLNLYENDLIFNVEKYGKPVLVLTEGRSNLEYNVSHSGDFVVLAFTKAGKIGIDIEKYVHIPEYKELVKNFFAEEEKNMIIESEDERLFFRYWTVKEAYVKALGIGLNKNFASFYIKNNKIVDNKELIEQCEVFSMYEAENYYIGVVVEKTVLL